MPNAPQYPPVGVPKPVPPPPPPAPPNYIRVIGLDLFGICQRRADRENERRSREWREAMDAYRKQT